MSHHVKYDQNFLVDLNIAKKIIKFANLNKTDIVLEIGFGLGILTKIIQPKVSLILAVDIDNNLSNKLKQYCEQYNIKNIKILNIDFLKYNFQNDLKFKIISNLPYSIASKIIQKILPTANWTIAIFMIQKELAIRINSKINNKAYSYISLFTSYYACSKILFNVQPTCFKPQPKITSSVILLVHKQVRQISDENKNLLFGFIKHCFKTRRKTILNCISSFRYCGKPKALNILTVCNINIFLRPNNLTLSNYLKLTEQIKKLISINNI